MEIPTGLCGGARVETASNPCGDTAIKGMEYFHGLGVQYLIAVTATIAFSVIAIFTRNEKFHAAFAVTALLYLMINGFLDYEIVG